ncbi:hypothetical protein Avbf_16848 [Armadillidium vulgare]|nr:hypothetical protein Avbf_16848 [Armadillidium vulgare]
MRCTLLRLLEKVKNLELKNSLDVIKFLNITSHNADGCGNLLEEGIPEVIPKRDCPCFYFTGFDLEILNNCGAKNKSYNQGCGASSFMVEMHSFYIHELESLH